jgi:NAD(P)-dependent dehydrogenase (short-subunit alcohol dehydrogenase family)
MKVLQDQMTIVTGGGSGIDRAIVIVIAQHDARVVVGNCWEELGYSTNDEEAHGDR